MQLCVCRLGPGVTIDAAEVFLLHSGPCALCRRATLKLTLSSRSFTYAAQRCISVAGLLPAVDVYLDESRYFDRYPDPFPIFLSSLQTSLLPPCSTSVDRWTTCALHGRWRKVRPPDHVTTGPPSNPGPNHPPHPDRQPHRNLKVTYGDTVRPPSGSVLTPELSL